jgi:hypothetical protein
MAFDTIDVTDAGMEILSFNHSSHAESSALLEDLRNLLKGLRPPDVRERSMERIGEGSTAYWKYHSIAK